MPLFDKKGPPEGTGSMTGRKKGYGGKNMPIGKFKDFAECVAYQKTQGHDEDSANKICGKLEQLAKEEKLTDDGKIIVKENVKLNFSAPIEITE